jgi:hypothetical protein
VDDATQPNKTTHSLTLGVSDTLLPSCLASIPASTTAVVVFIIQDEVIRDFSTVAFLLGVSCNGIHGDV